MGYLYQKYIIVVIKGFLSPGTSLEPTVYPTTETSAFAICFLQLFSFVRKSTEHFPGIVSNFFLSFNYDPSGPNNYRYEEAFYIPHSLNLDTLIFIFYFLFSRDSSVGTALGYGLDDRGSRVRFPAGAGYLSLHHRVQNGSGVHPASYSMGTRGSFPGGKAAGA
jgi:hypothetical protein